MRKYRLIFLFSLLLLMPSESAMAFMPPSFLTLVAASTGYGVWWLFILISVNCILIFKFTKRVFKKKIVILCAIIFVALILIRWKEIRLLNSPVAGLGTQLELDLNTISNKEIKDYRIFVMPRPIYKTLKIENIEFLNFLPFEDLMLLFVDKIRFDEIILRHRIRKADKLLFMCEFGAMSRITASLFAEYGYHARFAVLHRINNNKSNLISAEFIKEKVPASGLVVLPYEMRDKAKQDIYFGFNLTDDNKFFHLSGNNQIKIVSHEEFRPEMAQENNIICGVDLQEMLTKYLLDDRGIKKTNLYKFPHI